MNRLKEQYNKEIRTSLSAKLGEKNVMAVPQIKKVVLNAGIGKTLKDSKMLDAIVNDMKAITGQQPVKTEARKSIAGFKIREGQVVGITVTLRGERMYDFLDRLINVALPRVRDFRGLNSNAFDGKGNYNIGLREQIVFPEISEEGLDHTFGLQVTITTNAGNDEKGRELLTSMGFPFQKE